MQKAIFLDRDGTINIDEGNTYDVMRFRLYPGAADALRKLQTAGYLLVVVTDQGGIEAGRYTKEQVEEMNKRLAVMLGINGVTINRIYYCPHNNRGKSEKDWCWCGKPNTGMIESAVRDFGIDLSESWMIGDKTSDVKTGINAGTRTILVLTGEAGKDKRYEVSPTYVAQSLTEAAELIMLNNSKKVVQNG